MASTSTEYGSLTDVLGIRATAQQVGEVASRAAHGHRAHGRVGLDATLTRYAVRCSAPGSLPFTPVHGRVTAIGTPTHAVRRTAGYAGWGRWRAAVAGFPAGPAEVNRQHRLGPVTSLAPTVVASLTQGIETMLWTIVLILLVLWLLGLVSSYTLGGFIHLLLVVAIIIVIVNLVRGRKPL
jgi:hypothetical protein